jgi:hypothetical protein
VCLVGARENQALLALLASGRAKCTREALTALWTREAFAGSMLNLVLLASGEQSGHARLRSVHLIRPRVARCNSAAALHRERSRIL